MFDRTNATHLSTLKTEVNSDPIAMGYDANGPTSAILKKLNDTSENVGGETGNQVFTPKLLLEVMELSDFGAQQVDDAERRYIEAFMNRSDLNENIDSFRAKIKSAFKNNSTTSAAIDALVKPLSRGEVLFGDGTVISRTDWFASRDS